MRPCVGVPALRVELFCHPHSPCTAALSIGVGLERDAGHLALEYVLRGPMTQLRIPTPASPALPDRLWAHTCCEVFLARPEDAVYEEWNLSPSGQRAHYVFDAYRVRGPDPAAMEVAMRCEHDAATLTLAARIPIDDDRRVVGLACVVEDARGELCYWALRHGPGRPDFHARTTFALLVDRHSVTLLPERDSP